MSLPEPIDFLNTSSSTHRRRPIFNLPFPRNRDFAHREEVLSEIHGSLQSQECPAVALVGLGGIGKTEVAREYCYRYREHYEVVLWLRADTYFQISHDVQDAAQIQGFLHDKESASSIEDARVELLRQANRSWLLVYDNVNDFNFLQEFWASEARIIITSRDPHIASIAVRRELVISPMSDDEGTKFLLQIVGRSSSQEELDAASAISHDLGGHPLGLALVAYQIRKRQLPLARFCDLYVKHRNRILKQPMPMSISYNHTLETLWIETFLHLSEGAELLLWLLSVLNPDGVERGFLEAAPLEEIFGSNIDDFELEDLFFELQTVSLVDRRPPGDTLVVHRLVQSVARQRCPKAKLMQIISFAASCILQSLGSEHRQVDAQLEESLICHLIALERCVREFASNPGVREQLVNMEVLRVLQIYVRERRWLMNLHSRLVTKSISTHGEGQQPENADRASTTTLVPTHHEAADEISEKLFENADWASTTTLVPTHHEAADEIFGKLFASDPQFASSASTLLEVANKETFERKCADLLSLFLVHLQDEQSSSAELFQELKIFTQHATKVLTSFKKALENVRIGHGTRKEQYSNEASANHAIVTVDRDGRRHSNVGILDTNLGIPELEADSRLVSSAESDGPDIEQKRKSEGSRTTSGDLVTFVLTSEALQRFRKELDSQSQLYAKVVKESKRPPAKPEQVSGSSIDLPSYPARRREPKTVTVTWKCKCGVDITDQYTEFVEGAVQTYIEERTLRHRSRSNGQNTSPRLRRWFDHIRGKLRGILNPLNEAFVRRQMKSQEVTAPRVTDDGSVESPPVSNPIGHPKHLQLCISRHRRYIQTNYTSHSLKIESDKMLYDLLRAQYTRLTGRWKQLLSLRQISQIRFVKFRLRTNKLVTVEAHSEMEARIRESLPRENDDNYDFAPPEPDFLPPIGHNEMMHYFYKSCTGQDDDFHIRRLPGHKLDPVPFQLTEEEKHVWGIELVESENLMWLYLSIPVFIVLFSSIVFGTIWAIVLHDIQGGFTVAGYIVTSGLALLGSIQVVLENV